MDISYMYVVLSGGSEKKLRDTDALIQTVKGIDAKSIIILEYGQSGDNPHINIISKSNMRPDNLKRCLMTSYYGKEYLQSNKGNKYLAKVQKVKNYENVKNIGVYLTKEKNHKVLYDGSTLLDDILDMPSYEEHQTALEQSRLLSTTDNAITELLIQKYYETYCHQGVDCEGNKKPYYTAPVNKETFIELVQQLINEGYGLVKNLRSIKYVFVVWSSKLGQGDYLANMIRQELQFITNK